jgi:hypothetical protein
MSYTSYFFICFKSMTYRVYFSIRNFISRIEKLCGSAALLYFTMKNVKLGHGKDVAPVVRASQRTGRARHQGARLTKTTNPQHLPQK